MTLSVACGPKTGSKAGETQTAKAPKVDPCDTIPNAAAEHWNPKIKENLNFPRLIFAGSVAAADAEFVVRNLDKFVTSWHDELKVVCRTGTPQPIAQSHDTSPTCLDESLEQFRVLVYDLDQAAEFEFTKITDLFAKLSECAGHVITPALEIRENPFGDDLSDSDDTDFDDDLDEDPL